MKYLPRDIQDAVDALERSYKGYAEDLEDFSVNSGVMQDNVAAITEAKRKLINCLTTEIV